MLHNQRLSRSAKPLFAGSIPAPALNYCARVTCDRIISNRLAFPNSFPNTVHGVPVSSADVYKLKFWSDIELGDIHQKVFRDLFDRVGGSPWREHRLDVSRTVRDSSGRLVEAINHMMA